jgi:energy-coupling factor transporter ATP-binding protein EcfA2
MDDPKWLEFLDLISIEKKLTTVQKTTLKAKFPTFNGMANDRDLIEKFGLTDTGWKKRLGKSYKIFGIEGDGNDKATPLQKHLQQESLNWQCKQEQDSIDTPPIPPTTPIQPPTIPQIDWLDRSRQLLEAQKYLTTNRLLKKSNRKIDDDINVGLVERKERPKMKEVEDSAHGSERYHPVEYIAKHYEHEAFLSDVVGKPARGKHIAIIGEPGAGKTTILTKIGAWLIGQAEQQPEEPLVVAWISLASLEKQELSEYFYTSWLKSAHPAARPPKNWEDELVKLIEQKRVWLLLDGLDEISKSDSLNWLKEQLAGWGHNLRIVVTCRINQWEASAGGNILTNSFDVYHTQDYSYETTDGTNQVQKFISNWFKDDKKGNEISEQLYDKLNALGKEAIKDLVRNPLRLTLLCESWDKEKQDLPATQSDLYQRFVDYLYGWKANVFPEEVKLKKELDLALGELAKVGLNRLPSNNDGSVPRFRFTASEIRELWADRPDTLLPAADKLGWLNVVEKNPINPVYAFYHPTFQEYFAACSIPDWDYFLPKKHKKHIDRPVPCNDECIPTYRIFEQEWRQVILFWIGRISEDISDAIKEEFIKRLTDFQGQDGGFYRYRAYIMAAIVVGEFKSSKQAELIVEKIIEYAFGYFIPENNKWRNYLYSGESFARATIPFTHRQYAIKSLQNRLSQSNSSDDLRSDVESALYQITMSSEKIVEEDNWKSSDDLDFYVDPFDSEFEKQRIKKQRIEKAITSFNQNDYRNCSVDIKILSQAVGNEQAIKALIAFIGQYKYHGISTVCYGFNAAVALGKIAVGNKSVVKDLIDILQNNNANHKMYICVMYVAIRAIVTRSEMPLVIKNVKKYLTKESCESNFHRFNNCYIIVFQYAQSLTYPEFYKAWHQREDSVSFNLDFSNDD